MQSMTFRKLLKENCMCKTIPNYKIITGCDIQEIRQVLFDVNNYFILTKLKQEIRESLNGRELFFEGFGLARLIKINVVISREKKHPFEKQYNFDKDSKTITLYKLKPVKYNVRPIFNIIE